MSVIRLLIRYEGGIHKSCFVCDRFDLKLICVYPLEERTQNRTNRFGSANPTYTSTEEATE